jgi:hypothetical protein
MINISILVSHKKKHYAVLCVTPSMSKLFFISVVILFYIPVLGHSQCAFTTKNKNVRKDQYSQSSKSSIDKSKKEMADQQDEFDQKKYQADVKGKAVPKRKTVPRYL